jgi:hypothetical protein
VQILTEIKILLSKFRYRLWLKRKMQKTIPGASDNNCEKVCLGVILDAESKSAIRISRFSMATAILMK